MSKNILLLDTNISAKPIYDYLITTGNNVFVAGGNPNDALAKSVENYINIDYSVISEVEKAIVDHSIEYLVPGGNDLSYKICAEVNEKFNFYNIDTIEINDIINNKAKFRQLADKLNLHTPKLISYQIEKIIKPVIIKPADAFSGHGITVLMNPNAESLALAINDAENSSKTQSFLVEEFVEGQLFSHSAFIVDQEIVQDFIVEEHCIVNPFAVDTSKVVWDFDASILDALRTDILKLAKELNLSDGLIHTQFISNSKNFWIIEITRRCPGDLYNLLIELSTGFPYAEFYAKPFLDLKNGENKIDINKSMVFRHTLSVPEQTNVHSINYAFPFRQIKYFPYALSGDHVNESPAGRIGILFGKSENKAEFDTIFQSVINRTLYSID